MTDVLLSVILKTGGYVLVELQQMLILVQKYVVMDITMAHMLVIQDWFLEMDVIQLALSKLDGLAKTTHIHLPVFVKNLVEQTRLTMVHMLAKTTT